MATYDEKGEFAAILAAEVGSGRAVAICSHAEINVLDRGVDVDNSLVLKNAILWAYKVGQKPMDFE